MRGISGFQKFNCDPWLAFYSRETIRIYTQLLFYPRDTLFKTIMSCLVRNKSMLNNIKLVHHGIYGRENLIKSFMEFGFCNKIFQIFLGRQFIKLFRS